MNLSVLCVLVSVLCGCVMAESEGPAPGSSQAAATADTATPAEEDPGRDKRFFLNHPITGRLHYALPVSERVGVAPPASFSSAAQPVGFPQSRTSFPAPQPFPQSHTSFPVQQPFPQSHTSFPVQHPFPQTPSLRTSNPPFNNFNPRYRSSRGRGGVSFQELADYVNHQQRQQENRYNQQQEWHRRQKQYPDVIDTKDNSFP